jgi:hypothetical protein
MKKLREWRKLNPTLYKTPRKNEKLNNKNNISKKIL